MIKKLLESSIVRFLAVGVVNTLVGAGVMAFCYSALGLGTGVSTAMNYLFGGAVSFFLNKRFTFRAEAKNGREYAAQIVKFALTVAVCWFAAYSLAKPVITRLLSSAGETVRDYGVMLGCMAIYTVLNYLGQRFFAFHKGGEK